VNLYDLPDGLLEHLRSLTPAVVKRRLYIYFNGRLLYDPVKQYVINVDEGTLNIRTNTNNLQVLTISDPHGDERWCKRQGESWARL